MASGCEKDTDLNSRYKGDPCRTCEKLTRTVNYGKHYGKEIVSYKWVDYSQKHACTRCEPDTTGGQLITPKPMPSCTECIDESYQNKRTAQWVPKATRKKIVPSDPCEVCKDDKIVERCPDADMECIAGKCVPICIGGCIEDLCQECKCDDPPRCSSRSCHDTCGLSNYECIEGSCVCTLGCNEPNLPDVMDDVDDNGVVTGCICGCQAAIDGCGTNEYGDQLKFVAATCSCEDEYAGASSLNMDLIP